MRSEMTLKVILIENDDLRLSIDNLDFVLTLCLNPCIFVVSGKQL